MVANTDSGRFIDRSPHREGHQRGRMEVWQLGRKPGDTVFPRRFTPSPFQAWVLCRSRRFDGAWLGAAGTGLRLVGLSARIAATAVSFSASSVDGDVDAQWHKDQIGFRPLSRSFLDLDAVAAELASVGAMAILAGTFGLWMVRDHIIEVMAGASL